MKHGTPIYFFSNSIAKEVFQCFGKQRYVSEEVAWYVYFKFYKARLRKSKIRIKRDDSGLNCYRCKFCGFWHLGRRKKREGKIELD
ncbi:hypothetical protein [Cecembia calidifontis]|uniref:Uncharacterized protein n=1 Tax=Cecembia calidifontis TaxID=1187080 RepID=A0A4Q7P7I1_9BACT|nr:hypothetical protein [Cecembia calidifontis]RZS95777.1 hypothetical protein BC751_1319 [Cecembia calidifontis]